MGVKQEYPSIVSLTWASVQGKPCLDMELDNGEVWRLNASAMYLTNPLSVPISKTPGLFSSPVIVKYVHPEEEA